MIENHYLASKLEREKIITSTLLILIILVSLSFIVISF